MSQKDRVNERACSLKRDRIDSECTSINSMEIVSLDRSFRKVYSRNRRKVKDSDALKLDYEDEAIEFVPQNLRLVVILMIKEGLFLMNI